MPTNPRRASSSCIGCGRARLATRSAPTGANKPFESVYVSVAGTLIDVGGFDEVPYLVPRFSKVTGEIYGLGPGMTCLPDVKMLNEMAKTVVKAAQKIVDPPLQLPDSGFLVPIKTTPGSLNSLRQQIIRAFYVEWLLMPSE